MAARVHADPPLHGQGVTTLGLCPNQGPQGNGLARNKDVKSKNGIWSDIFKGKCTVLRAGASKSLGLQFAVEVGCCLFLLLVLILHFSWK